MSVPSFGVGTFRLTGQTVIDSVRNALEVGYRAVDTAQIYGNEAEVGQAIAESGVPRDQLFLTTKIWVDNYAADKLIPSLRDSLAKLRTDYVDLLLIHWPAPGNGVELREYIEVVGAAEIATNQIELSPYLQNPALTAFLQDQGITVTSYMTLAYGKVLKDPVLAAIADKHQATVAQVALAWALQRGYSVIPSSTKRENLASNLLAQDLHLDADDMAAIAALDRNGREVDPPGLAPAWD